MWKQALKNKTFRTWISSAYYSTLGFAFVRTGEIRISLLRANLNLRLKCLRKTSCTVIILACSLLDSQLFPERLFRIHSFTFVTKVEGRLCRPLFGNEGFPRTRFIFPGILRYCFLCRKIPGPSEITRGWCSVRVRATEMISFFCINIRICLLPPRSLPLPLHLLQKNSI